MVTGGLAAPVKEGCEQCPLLDNVPNANLLAIALAANTTYQCTTCHSCRSCSSAPKPFDNDNL